MAESTKTVETTPVVSVPAPAGAPQPVAVQGVPLTGAPVGPPNTSAHTEPGGIFVVDGRVVDAQGNDHPKKTLDDNGNVVDRKAPPEPENPDRAEIERLKAELAAAKADADAKTKAKDAK